MVCPLYRGCPLLRGSNRIILIGRDKFGDLVLSIVERYLIQCPFLGGSSLRGSTVLDSTLNVVSCDLDDEDPFLAADESMALQGLIDEAMTGCDHCEWRG